MALGTAKPSVTVRLKCIAQDRVQRCIAIAPVKRASLKKRITNIEDSAFGTQAFANGWFEKPNSGGDAMDWNRVEGNWK